MSQSTSTQANGTPVPNKASEVGWLFVPQYYTFMNKDPSRLHCFYTKKSTMVHGTEMIRHGYFGTAVRTHEDPVYLMLFNLILTIIGLALLKEVGRKVEPE